MPARKRPGNSRPKSHLVVDPPETPRNVADQHSADNRLLSACLENRRSAPWGQAVEIFRRVIASTVIKVLRRFGPAKPEHVDDLIQEVYLRLCADDYRLLRECRADRPAQVFGLVQAVTMTTALDHYRAIISRQRGGDIDVVSIEGRLAAEQADSTAQQILERELLIGQLDRHLQQLGRQGAEGENSRDRQIFWLYYRHGFTAKDIASIPALQLSEKGVESVIHRLTSELRRIVGEGSANPKGEES